MEECRGPDSALTAGAQPSLAPSASDSPREWNAVIREFLSTAGLTQAARGFDADMVIMNPGFERDVVPGALDRLLHSLVCLGKHPQQSPQSGSLDQRKLEHVHLRSGTEPGTQSQTIKEISHFLARNRARNNASNTAEFLSRRSRDPEGDPQGDTPSCARTDAKSINRDLQMKYDIAKNKDGSLRSTLRTDQTLSTNQLATPVHQTVLEGRLRDVEDHLAVRYVPLPPNSITDRLKFLEDRIIQLERDFPPWAALHLNQPNREWPPRPQQTPIIVPPRMLSTSDPASIPVTSMNNTPKKQTRADSSLRKAVLERLEVQQATSTRGRGTPMDVDKE
ncbi:hypothetical protein BDM02DRAFT_3265153 [Thelephora ganbajun]|uniref:Uncharacterized protein n=1 Tax=Thelephora ganbajun TaxID=370292 RepID=A0ACB6ZWH5_THEGA|nr:hypothetical protein BDM02DRAFT_3265153 [Thelephora ganbajun]